VLEATHPDELSRFPVAVRGKALAIGRELFRRQIAGAGPDATSRDEWLPDAPL
jgi:hypothetical protein